MKRFFVYLNGVSCGAHAVLATSTAHPWVIKISLLHGLLNRGEAYLDTYLADARAKAGTGENQSINQSTASHKF